MILGRVIQVENLTFFICLYILNCTFYVVWKYVTKQTSGYIRIMIKVIMAKILNFRYSNSKRNEVTR